MVASEGDRIDAVAGSRQVRQNSAQGRSGDHRRNREVLPAQVNANKDDLVLWDMSNPDLSSSGSEIHRRGQLATGRTKLHLCPERRWTLGDLTAHDRPAGTKRLL
jgi:hypothetical protein